MKKTSIISLIAISFLFGEMSLEEKNALLKERLLAQTSTKIESRRIYLPLRVNRVLQDEVLVEIDSHEQIFITKETLKYISSLLKKEYRDKFIIKSSRDGFVPLNALEQLGIQSRYNSKMVMIDISLPVQLKKASTINLGRRYRNDTNGSIPPEEYSGGINLYLNQQYTDSLKEKSFNLSSELFLNIKDTILEGRVNYYEEERRVQRGRVRLVRDDRESQLRYQLGDISLPIDKRVSHMEGFGISVEKNLNIGDNYREKKSSRVNSFEFFIQNRSRVEIYINEHYRNSIELDAGTHNLYDLHLSSGINKIRLKIIEEGGKIETIEFNDFYYSEIVQKGFLSYGFGVGVESEQGDNGWVYHKDKKITSSYIRYGLFDNITLKVGLQTAEEYFATSIDTLLGSDFGLFDAYVVQSKNSQKIGYKRGVEYRTNIGVSTLNLGYEDIEKEYLSFNSNSNRASKLYRANFYTQLNRDITFGLSASNYIKEEEREEKYALLLRKNFGNLMTEINFEDNRNNQDRDEQIISFNLEYQFNRYSGRYKQYLNEEKQQLHIRHKNRGRYGLDSGLQIERNSQSIRYNLDADYNNEKFQLDTTYRISDYKEGQRNDTLSLQLSTGVVFAGDRATITTPINSSFIIVDNDDRLKEPLGINGYHKSDSDKYDTYTIEIGDYTHRELFVDESQLDFGIDLTSSEAKFTSNYRTGSQMNIAIDNFYSIEGFFYDRATHKPLINRAFKVFNRESGEKRMSFTNKEGKFIIHHVQAGVYNITFVHQRGYKGVARYNFEIKETKESLQDIGVIYIDMPPKRELH